MPFFQMKDKTLEGYTGTEEIVTVPQGTEFIDSYAFEKNRTAKKIILPCTVKKIDNFAFVGCTALEKIVFQGNNLRCIGWSAFADCKSLESIVLPDSIEELGGYAFENCKKLKTVYIPACRDIIIPDTAFTGCRSLDDFRVSSENKEYCSGGTMLLSDKGERLCAMPSASGDMRLPEGIKVIGDHAFENCRGLKNIILPETLEKIESYAFLNCDKLEKIILPQNAGVLEDGIFDGCIKLKELCFRGKISSMGEIIMVACHPDIYAEPQAFSSMKNMKIKYKAIEGFAKKYYLSETDENTEKVYEKYIRGQRRKLYDTALENRELLSFMLEKNIIPKSDIEAVIAKADREKVEIMAMLLEYQNSIVTEKDRKRNEEAEFSAAVTGYLTSALAKKEWRFENIEGGVRILGYRGCDREVVVPLGIGKLPVSEIGNNAFSPDGPRISDEERAARENITSVILPDSVTKIGEGAFKNCSNLEKVNIPEGVTAIGKAAFRRCEKLEKIELPQSLETIGGEAFCLCVNITEMDIPEKVTEIADGLFSCCDNLFRVGMGENIVSVGKGAFEECWFLDDLYIPETTGQIGKDAFSSCWSLTLTVKENSEGERYAIKNKLRYKSVR